TRWRRSRLPSSRGACAACAASSGRGRPTSTAPQARPSIPRRHNPVRYPSTSKSPHRGGYPDEGSSSHLERFLGRIRHRDRLAEATITCLPGAGAPGLRPRDFFMTNPVSLSFDGPVAVIRIDNPPVNALSPETIDGLSAALAQAQADPGASAIVVHAAGRTFIAGADIKGLENVVWGGDSGAPEMHDLLQRIEQGKKPVVMAMHGTALGGGMEVAMAGHYRVAVADAQMGLPEVNLGIIPGAEGTQRLPRLVGVAKAIEMCVTGKPIKAAEALNIGLIDRIVDGDLV